MPEEKEKITEDTILSEVLYDEWPLYLPHDTATTFYKQDKNMQEKIASMKVKDLCSFLGLDSKKFVKNLNDYLEREEEEDEGMYNELHDDMEEELWEGELWDSANVNANNY